MLDDLLTPHVLFNLAGEQAFLRGEAYFAEGAVRHLVADAASITAQVAGTEDYRVELSDDDGELAYDCTCPRAADGYFCKHCVALGLAWLTRRARETDTRSEKNQLKNIRAHLLAQPTAALVDMLLNLASKDENLFQNLLAKTQTGAKRVTMLRARIERATTPLPGRDWTTAADYLDAIETLVEALSDLLEPETAGALIDLCEYAIARVEALIEQVDGEGELDWLIEQLCDLHRDACEMAAPDPAELAGRLFDLEMGLPFQLCHMDVLAYQELLGEIGLRAYRERAEAAWAKPRPDHRLTAIMKNLAQLAGDVDALLAIEARDLTSAWRFLVIAKILKEAGREDEALDWAERGQRAFPKRPDWRLRDFLVEAYLARGRHEEATALAWERYTERPGFESFKQLHAVATHIGNWPALRERALACIETESQRHARTYQSKQPDHSVRVEIALWEEDPDVAWNLIQQGGCEHRLLLALADKLEAGRADDAIILYQRVIPPLVEETHNHAYAEAAALLRRVARLLQARGRAPDFVDYLLNLRARYKAKRNFMKLLDDVV
jgi:uncharacterized Zn finger protein